MDIKELQLDHFGRFHGNDIKLQPGINVIYGPNESGKSTIHGFMQCMLFGAERLRGRGAGKDVYSKYQPWELRGNYSGRMTFEYKGNKYRIVRNFQRDDEQFAVIDVATGKTVLEDNHIISELIPGLTPVNYRNSLSCGQLSAAPDSQFAGNMQSFLANMSMSASETIDVTKAMAFLKEERKKANSRISEEEYEKCLTRQDEIKEELAGRDELVRTKGEILFKREKLKKDLEELDKKIDEIEKNDRNERMKAIQLIQENNDVADMYRLKKKQVRELENNNLDEEDKGKIREDVFRYERAESEKQDLNARNDELESQGGGNILRNMALILPAAALTFIVYMLGDMMGLDSRLHIAVTAILAVLTLIFAIVLFMTGDGSKKRIQEIQSEIDRLEKTQKRILQEYELGSFEELKGLIMDQNGSRETIARLNLELKQLHDRYDSIQAPLKPYLEKFGECVTLESDAADLEKEERENLKLQITELSKNAELIEWQIEQLATKQSELDNLEEKTKQMKEIHNASYEDLRALEITESVISELTSKIHGAFGTQLNEYVSQLLAMITDETHSKLTIDEKFQVLVDNAHMPVQPQQLSAGTADQIYFSVRIAVSQLLFQDEPMPLILDDSFAMYDDERLERTLGWLAGQRAFSQVIIFTCHHREAQILQKMCCPFSLYEL